MLADAMSAAGAPFEELDAKEAALRVPSIHAGGPALFETESGVLAADQCLDALRHSAESAGARVMENTAVSSVSDDVNRVLVRTGSTTVTASVVVVCAGHWTSGLLETAGVRLRLTPTLEQLAHLAPVTGNPVDTPVFIERGEPVGLRTTCWRDRAAQGRPARCRTRRSSRRLSSRPRSGAALATGRSHGASPPAPPRRTGLDRAVLLRLDSGWRLRARSCRSRRRRGGHDRPRLQVRASFRRASRGPGNWCIGPGRPVTIQRAEVRRRSVTTPALLWAAVPTAANTRHNQRQSPSSRPRTSRPDLVASLQRRTWPICATVVLFCFAMVYFFRWGPTVEHIPLWETPGDLWETYAATNAAVHGHFGAIYAPANSFYAFPAIVLALAPVAALTNALGLGTDVYPSHVVAYPQAFLLLGPYLVLISAFALFACDALAERLGVAWRSRAVLALAEGVALFNVSVFWGHPEYAIAVGFAVYSLIAAFDGRFTKAGWLFGAAVAFQPLVIVALPILLVLGGRRQALGFIVRGAIPAAVLVLAPLVSDAHTTLHALFDQAFLYPIPVNDHATPWTFLAPKLGGAGTHQMLGGGPIRLVSLLLACGVGWWALRWREPARDARVGIRTGSRTALLHRVCDDRLLPVARTRGRARRRGTVLEPAVRDSGRRGGRDDHHGAVVLQLAPVVAARRGRDHCSARSCGRTRTSSGRCGGPALVARPVGEPVARQEDNRDSTGTAKGRRRTEEEEQGGACRQDGFEAALTLCPAAVVALRQCPACLRRPLQAGVIMGRSDRRGPTRDKGRRIPRRHDPGRRARAHLCWTQGACSSTMPATARRSATPSTRLSEPRSSARPRPFGARPRWSAR